MKLESLPDDKYRITDSQMLNEYMHGGKGQLTLVGPQNTAHTYLFSRPLNSDDFPPEVVFVYVIHEGTKFYLGMLDQGTFRCTSHSRFNESCECVKGAKYIARLAASQSMLDNTLMKLYQSGRCARCGKLLDSNIALMRGFGKKCWNAHLVRKEAEERLNAELRSSTIQ